MKALIFILIAITFLLVSAKSTSITSFFIMSIETKAECVELKKEDCYYLCKDKVFLNDEGIIELEGFVCHDKSWEDPRG